MINNKKNDEFGIKLNNNKIKFFQESFYFCYATEFLI